MQLKRLFFVLACVENFVRDEAPHTQLKLDRKVGRYGKTFLSLYITGSCGKREKLGFSYLVLVRFEMNHSEPIFCEFGF